MVLYQEITVSNSFDTLKNVALSADAHQLRKMEIEALELLAIVRNMHYAKTRLDARQSVNDLFEEGK